MKSQTQPSKTKNVNIRLTKNGVKMIWQERPPPGLPITRLVVMAAGMRKSTRPSSSLFRLMVSLNCCSAISVDKELLWF